ncbi:hypothetical protein K6W56_24555, partial [Burkholderia contaminans]|nr:hypothetical protein [Burkholderia contaminans]
RRARGPPFTSIVGRRGGGPAGGGGVGGWGGGARRGPGGGPHERATEVLKGLKPGQEYAASNSFVLKAELGKGSAEHE